MSAILRGKVKDAGGGVLPKVTVTILKHPEVGRKLRRADGAFNMAVNGGGVLTINHEKVGPHAGVEAGDSSMAGLAGDRS